MIYSECKNSIYLLYMRKLSLLHKTLRPETETFDLSSGRDRNVGKMHLETVSRPRRRDQDNIPDDKHTK